MATWQAFGVEPTNDEASDEVVWARLRLHRNTLLSACDYTVLQDAQGDVEAWKAYRQELRDLPDNTTDPRQAVWPTPPQ